MENLVSFDNVTSIGPADDPNRIMLGKQTQLIHDFNAALYYFFIENDSLPSNLKKLACLKAIGRSRKNGPEGLKINLFLIK